jgi:hypothetical protein
MRPKVTAPAVLALLGAFVSTGSGAESAVLSCEQAAPSAAGRGAKAVPKVFERRRGAGVLVRFDEDRKQWTIADVWAGSAAAQAGLTKGEPVVSINGVAPPGLDPADQTAVSAAVRRFGAEIAARRAKGVDVFVVEAGGKERPVRVRARSMSAQYQRAVALSAGGAGGIDPPSYCVDCEHLCPPVMNGYSICEELDKPSPDDPKAPPQHYHRCRGACVAPCS